MQMYSFMQISRSLGGRFFTLQLVQSLKKKQSCPSGTLLVTCPWKLGGVQKTED